MEGYPEKGVASTAVCGIDVLTHPLAVSVPLFPLSLCCVDPPVPVPCLICLLCVL